jgi:hypothetical protein
MKTIPMIIFLCCFFILTSCFQENPVINDCYSPVLLNVYYPRLIAQKGYVPGGLCVLGSLALVNGYIHGTIPGQEDIERQKAWLSHYRPNRYPPYYVDIPDIFPLARKVFGMRLALHHTNLCALHHELSEGRPVLLLIGGDGMIDIVVLTGIDLSQNIVIIHYPAWGATWQGTGANVHISVSRFEELWRATGHRALFVK